MICDVTYCVLWCRAAPSTCNSLGLVADIVTTTRVTTGVYRYKLLPIQLIVSVFRNGSDSRQCASGGVYSG